MAKKKTITPSDIMDLEAYALIRQNWRREMVAFKKNRRIGLGPDATVYFESYETMLYQVQEMMHTERGGDEQMADELSAYNPLVPQGDEAVATIMFEIENEERRDRFLRSVGGVDAHFFMEVGGVVARGAPEREVERTNKEGKASSVHFLHFRFTPEQIALFRTPGTVVRVGVDHPNYGHMAILPEATRAALADDLAD
ncbi:MAG: DUF3501 family protein [Rhodospirillales bacterium]|nr:DUF3501 family protein [Rhodospirillales bacterium]